MTHPAPNECDTRVCPLDRRALLVAAGLATTATLAGCGDEPAAEADTPAPATSAPAPAAPSGSQQPGHNVPAGALTLVAHVPVGGGVVVDGGKVVVVQLKGGVFKAYDARCTHRGVPVNPPDAKGVMVCPRHKAEFKSGDGSVAKGPAERALSGIPVKVDGEYVVRV
jgi:nitrite reductase/ring-hydroxylating ferredoxin subunit